MLSRRLRELDDRVLGLEKRRAALRTVEGWRRYAARWRWTAALAAASLAVSFLTRMLGDDSFYAFGPMGGILAFQAGMMKAEDNRLNRRGPLERLRPPGL